MIMMECPNCSSHEIVTVRVFDNELDAFGRGDNVRFVFPEDTEPSTEIKQCDDCKAIVAPIYKKPM